ncbi:MAG: phytanoyl-CoA dioxygenase family protein [Planctomycetia bacterium]|nr:phytanoyl-CoA dioxygenase family protein [Planctomycetia bacterium]
MRDPLAISAGIRTLAIHPSVRRVAESVLGPRCFVARALLFDKTERANWKVAWHQDLTITVQHRVDVADFGPWSVKEGIVHVQPPVEVLTRMLAVRVHLDDCHVDNGPVRVLPGSHLHGRLTADEIEAWKVQHPAVECLAARGAILAFRPLLVHASSPARVPGHRRVVHFEFAADDLPAGLEWHRRS